MRTFSPKHRIVILLCILIAIIGFLACIKTSSGIVTYIILTGALASMLLCLREIHFFIGRFWHRDLKLTCYWNILLVVCSVMLVLILFEAYLQINHQKNPTESLTLPDEWQYRDVVVEGAKAATYWHGKLHVYNEDNMRRTTPFLPKQPDVCRIMVVGDSLTYGKGVDVNDTYPHVIETELSKQYRVEVLNLGVCGVQSEDILQIVLRFTPQLRPTLVLYGVCQNDFLESGEGQKSRENMQSWPFPLPTLFKQFMLQRTLSGEFFERSYGELLMRLGIRADFYSNILHNLYEYQIRFTRDVTAMNFSVVQYGLPPMISMVLDQYPELNSRGHKVTHLAESIMKLVGMEVISTEDYYQKYNGRQMGVSPWEGHPNEEAHRIFAEYFVRTLNQHPVLQRYKK